MRPALPWPLFTRPLFTLLVQALALLAAMTGGSPVLADGLDAFLQHNTCPVAASLSAIATANGQAPDQGSGGGAPNPFIVVAPERGGQRYVQCLFLENNDGIVCEAASGFYGPRHNGRPLFRVSSGGLRELARFGFDIGDTKGNFSRLLAVREDGDFVPIAETMLRALYFGYGADTGSPLEIFAPLAADPGLHAHCSPVG